MLIRNVNRKYKNFIRLLEPRSKNKILKEKSKIKKKKE